MTFGLLAGTATVASATGQEPPVAGDSKATAYSGNATECDDLGVGGGDELSKEDLTFATRNNDDGEPTYLDITAVDAGVTVTAIVIKGSNAYNVYVPGEKGMAEAPPHPTWLDLHSPLNSSGKPAAISHWFVCGEKDDETTTTTTTDTSTSETTTTTSETSETSTTETTSSGETSTSGSSPVTTTTSGAGGVVTTTSEAGVSPAGDSDDLASTGFSSGWLVGLGALLLAGGGALVLLSRMRRSKA
ncbi:hypothetical protein [Prauserella muralis]|nr:hypothetical protein [Prauserella muralis]